MNEIQDIKHEEFVDCVSEYHNIGEICDIDLNKIRNKYKQAECDLAKKFASKVKENPYSLNHMKINTPQESYNQELSISKMIFIRFAA